ncbi:hypothetical protein OQA88_11876 [Cercophora sp. LCS_1]
MASRERLKQALAGFFRREERSTWPNPRDSIGEVVDCIKDKRGIVQTLGVEIRAYMTDYADQPGVQLSMDLMYEFYMFGPNEDTATPTVFFRSSSKPSRRRARKAIKNSRIMENYPFVELAVLGPRAGFIELVADESTSEDDPLSQFYSDNSHMVSASPHQLPVGRRLFVTSSEHGGGPRIATGGPLLCIGGRHFQLTAGHVFQEVSSGSPSKTFKPPRMEDLDLGESSDLESDEEGDSDSVEQLTTTLHGSVSPSSNQFTPGQPRTGIMGGAPSGAARTQRDNSHTRVAAGAVRVGRPSQVPGPGGLDYALVELEPPHNEDFMKGLNRIPSRNNSQDHWLYITGFGHVRKKTSRLFKIPIAYMSVVVFNSSSGLLKGKLCSTPSYLRLSAGKEFHEVFALRLEGGLVAKGDCGSPVVDKVYGSFLGHIVAGAVGTNLAYIVSASRLVGDIEERFDGTVEFSPKLESLPSFEPTKSRLHPSHRRRMRQHRIPRYDLGTPSQIIEFGSKLFVDHTRTLDVPDGGMPVKTSRCPDPNGLAPLSERICHQQAIQPAPASAYPALLLEPGPCGSGALQAPLDKLPSELKQEIFSFCDVTDILNFRLASRSWNDFVVSQELPIAFSHIRRPHIPALAIQLFPPSSNTDLRYIYNLWQRYSTACGLAALMSDWITTDMFLQKTPEERAQFRNRESLMRRRMVPILLIIMHFFDTYRTLRSDPSTADLDHAHLENRIMSEYDNETLLHVHQFFPVLMTFQARKLRPPSYFSLVERSLRGYLSEPPPDNVQIAMLYIGGLPQLLNITQVKSYEELRRAVDDWYESVTRESQSVNDGKGAKPSLELTRERKGKGKATMSLTTSLEAGRQTRPPMGRELQEILERLPVSKGQIWTSTAESILIERGVIGKVEDLKGHAGVFQELVLRQVLWADIAFCRRGMNGDIDVDAEVEELKQ